MKSSLKNMVLVLFCITLISAAGVGAVNMITEKPIADAKSSAKQKALAQVLPEFDVTEQSEHTADGFQIVAHKAIKGNEIVGYAIESVTKKGFSGEIKLVVGFDPKGTILNVNVLEQKETPGLGANIANEDLKKNKVLVSIKGKEASETRLCVKKDGGDVDALTAATISSRAYLDAVSRAYKVFEQVTGGESEIQAATGATKKNKEE